MDELTGTAQEAKRDWDSSHITWKSDLDIMSLKGKIQQRFDLVIGTTPRYFRHVPHLRTPTVNRRCAPTSFGKSKPIICDAAPLKDQGTMTSKEVSKSH
ncbi:hypothetical protein CDAR_417551 [Caerostris darwini]|uniref:Uncharacterized protein n=1 Tax=Caerostris darwini TaxID=1538125 RepID=A0AAV4WEM4_9ARAC|nr:hypothetical protein CDAR_417551 [Caerostris darwini]